MEFLRPQSIYLPVGSRKSGRAGVRCITLGLGLEADGRRCSRCSPRLRGAADGGGRQGVDGGGDAWLGRLESICSLRHVQKPSIVEMTMCSFLFKKWLGAENTRRAAPPKMQRLRMQKNTRPDAISRPQSPQSAVNSCQNPSLKMKKKARKKLIKNHFIL